jgi:ABC-type glycerol-3-phosphate transport system permease component
MNNFRHISRKKKIIGFIEYFILVFCSLLVIIPILWMVSTAFKSEPETIPLSAVRNSMFLELP